MLKIFLISFLYKIRFYQKLKNIIIMILFD